VSYFCGNSYFTIAFYQKIRSIYKLYCIKSKKQQSKILTITVKDKLNNIIILKSPKFSNKPTFYLHLNIQTPQIQYAYNVYTVTCHNFNPLSTTKKQTYKVKIKNELYTYTLTNNTKNVRFSFFIRLKNDDELLL